MCYDLLALTLTIVGLRNTPSSNAMWKILRKQGITYVLVTCLANIVPTVRNTEQNPRSIWFSCLLQRSWLRWIWTVSDPLPFWYHFKIYSTSAAMNVIFALPGKFFQKPSHHHLIFFVPATVIRSGSTCIITLSVYLASSQHHRIESNSCYFPGPTIEVRVTKLFFQSYSQHLQPLRGRD